MASRAALRAAAAALQAGDAAAALDALSGIPASPEAHFLAGKAHRALGDPVKALAAFQAACEGSEDAPGPLRGAAEAAEAAGDAGAAAAALERLRRVAPPEEAATLPPRLARALAQAGRGRAAVDVLLEGVEGDARLGALVALAAERVGGGSDGGDGDPLLAAALDALASSGVSTAADPDAPPPAALVTSIPVVSALVTRLAAVAASAEGEADTLTAAARAAALGRALLAAHGPPADAAASPASSDGPLPPAAAPLVAALEAWHTAAARFSGAFGDRHAGSAPLGDARFRAATAALAPLAGGGPGRPVATEAAGLLAWWAMLSGQTGAPAPAAARTEATTALSARFGGGAAPPAVCVALARLALADGRAADAGKAARHALRALRARSGPDAAGEGVLAARALAARAALADGDAAAAATEAGKALTAAGGLEAVLKDASPGSAAREAARAAARAARALGQEEVGGGGLTPDQVVSALAATPGAEAWARTDAGRLLLAAGDTPAAIAHLEAAVEAAATGVGGVSDGEAAAVRLWTGDAHWAAWSAGSDVSSASAAARHWLAAAAVDGPAAAPAFIGLARFYTPGAGGGPPPGDPARAARCARRAAWLDPSNEGVVAPVVAGLLGDGAWAAAAGLAQAAADAAPTSAWAWRAAAAAAAGGRDTTGEVAALQGALRCNPGSAPDWVRLSQAYLVAGRPAAAARVGERAVLAAKADGGGGHLASAAHAALAQAALAAGDPRRALEAARQAGLSPAAAATEAEAALVLAADARTRGEVSAAVGAAQRAAAAAASLGGLGGGGPPALLAAKLGGDAALALAAATSSPAPAKTARRLFARAAHAAPAAPGAWGDLAASLTVEIQALRVVGGGGDGGGSDTLATAIALMSTAERALRVGLRADPASARLWAALGSLPLLLEDKNDGDDLAKSRREYALRRALALDPGCGGAWAALIRLYASAATAEGTAAAASAVTAARARVPADPAIWAAAGFAARAAAGPDAPASVAADAAVDAYDHALTMDGGGTAEALLAVAEAAGRRGAPATAVVAAARAVGLAPTCSGARIALGSALLAGGGARSAALAATEFAAASACEEAGSGRGIPPTPAWVVSPLGPGKPSAAAVAAVGRARALAALAACDSTPPTAAPLTPTEAADVMFASESATTSPPARLLARAAHAAPADPLLRAAAADAAGLPGRALTPALSRRALHAEPWRAGLRAAVK